MVQKHAEEEIPSLLLGQNPELSEIAEEISNEEEDGCSNMLWYDDILGCALLVVMPLGLFSVLSLLCALFFIVVHRSK